MKKLFNYCACAIADVYKKCGMKDYLAQGYFIMFFAFTCILLSIIQMILYSIDVQLNKTWIIALSTPLLIEIFFFERLFPNSECIFKDFENRTDDRFRWMKTCFVLAFALLSLVCFVVTMFIFKP